MSHARGAFDRLLFLHRLGDELETLIGERRGARNNSTTLPMNATSRQVVAGTCLAFESSLRLPWTCADTMDTFDYA